MFGNNPVAPIDRRDDGSLLIKDVFYTIQGEGPDAGTPSIFVRLAGCNLRCTFCDTDFSGGLRLTLDDLIARVNALLTHSKARLIVITGGEPLIQNIGPFVAAMCRQQTTVAIETAGTVWDDGLDHMFGWPLTNRIICSPKTRLIADKIKRQVTAYKYIVRAGDVLSERGVPITATQLNAQPQTLFMPERINPSRVYIQPMDEGDAVKNERNLTFAAQICLQYGYQLSIQMHKIAGLD